MTNIPASVHARLLTMSRETGEDFNALLVRYGSERLLYRLSISPYAERFVLKGAWLFFLWGLPRRTTRDVDFLGQDPESVDQIRRIFMEVLSAGVDVDDGLAFQPETLRVQELRDDQEYGGIRVKVTALLGSARVHTQADIGFGDRLVSGGEEATLPTLLGHPAPRLRVYGPEATIAEKLEAVVRFGEANSRHKDYFDLHLLATERTFNGEALREQIRATFAQRGTALPDDVPVGLSDEFSKDPERQRQWRAFRRRSGADSAPELFSDVVAVVRSFALPPMLAAGAMRSSERAGSQEGAECSATATEDP